MQLEFKAQPLNLSCWKKEGPPSCRASEQARSVDLAVAGTFCLERESEKNVKLRILGNFLSWEGLGSTWPPKPQAPGGAHLGDKGFGKPVGTPASLPNAYSLQLQPSPPWGKEHEGGMPANEWCIHGMVSASPWMFASSGHGLCLLCKCVTFLFSFHSIFPGWHCIDVHCLVMNQGDITVTFL